MATRTHSFTFSPTEAVVFPAALQMCSARVRMIMHLEKTITNSDNNLTQMKIECPRDFLATWW